MRCRQRTGFMQHNMKTRFLILVPVIMLFCASVAVAAGQSAATNNASSATIQDDNSTNSIVSAVPETTQSTATVNLTVKGLQDEQKRISESNELTDTDKTDINNIYDQAIAQLKQAQKYEADANEFSQKLKDAPSELQKTKEELSKLTSFVPPKVSEDITLTEAEQRLTTSTLTLDQARKNSEYWENEPKRRADRRVKIPEESNAAQQKIGEIDKKIAALPTEANATELDKANLALLEAQKKSLKAQINANTQELLSYDARRDVLSAKRDLASRQLALAQKNMEFWQQEVNDIRRREAQVAKEEAEKAQKQTQPSTPEVIQKVIKENVDLAAEQAELAKRINDTTQYKNQIDVKLDAIRKESNATRDMVEQAHKKISLALGADLLIKRSELPNVQQNEQRLKTSLAEIADAQISYARYDKKWWDLRNVEQYADNLIGRTPLSESERQNLISQLQKQRDILENLKGSYSTYSFELAALDSNEKTYINTVQGYADFIDTNLLWVKTSSTFSLANIPEMGGAIQWLVSPQNWLQAAGFLWGDFKKNPFAYISIIALFALSLGLHRKIHVMIEDVSKKVSDVATDSYKHTLNVVLLTILLAVTWPILILFLEWRLSEDASGSNFIQALSEGLLYLTVTIFVLELLRHLTMPSGLMSDHFRVRDEALETIRSNLRWFFIIVVPLIFVFKILQSQQEGSYYNSAGRLTFIAMLVFLAIFLLRMLRLGGPVTGPYIKRHSEGWIARLKYIWYPLCLILPAGISITAALGYFYAARYLSDRLLLTILLVSLVVFFKAMLTRWLLVTRRKLALIERQKREAEAAAQEEAKETSEQQKQPEAAPPQPSQNKPEKTIFEISKQTSRLINAVVFILIVIGLWYIWQGALPALKALGEIVIWKQQNITLGAFVAALIIIIMTVITARNLPGLLEIVVLRRLPIDAAVRFAVTTVSRYLIVIVGVALAFTKIGIGWSKIQWLIAAMGVGLGFGLQEIFANFISGLIILFEQPIRVDDVVTVGDVTGTVNKIKIRATTIRKWDQRELVVPNKEFITGHLINWTLSDKILRQDFVVGVAYGSDITKTEKTLYQIAASDPAVLENPKPIVLFKSFGDSSLVFELRVYIAGIENYLPVWHRINCEIDNAFRKAGIEIAFPQCDIHVRSVETNIPLDIEKMP